MCDSVSQHALSHQGCGVLIFWPLWGADTGIFGQIGLRESEQRKEEIEGEQQYDCSCERKMEIN